MRKNLRAELQTKMRKQRKRIYSALMQLDMLVSGWEVSLSWRSRRGDRGNKEEGWYLLEMREGTMTRM